MSAARAFRSARFGGPGISPLSLGVPTAAYPGRVATNSDLIVAVDRQQTTLLVALTAGATTMTVLDPSMIAAFNLLSIDNEIVKTTGAPSGNIVPISRGFDGTVAAAHLSGASVLGLVDAWHHNALVSEIEAIETALGPNLVNVPLALPFLVSTAFKFAPQTPGGSLGVGANSITLTPVPLGVNGTDSEHYLYVSGGTGAAEPVLILGGSAVAGSSSGTLIIQCANAHSGAWTIQSATAGLGEALAQIASAGGGTVVIPAGLQTFYGPAVIPSNTYIRGLAGAHLQIAPNAWSQFTKGMLGADASSYHDIVIEGCEIDGNQPNNPGFSGAPKALVWFTGGSGTRISVRYNYIHGMPGNGTAMGYTQVWFGPSTGTTGWDCSYNTLQASGGMGGGFLTTMPDTTVIGNRLPGTWGDAGLVLNSPVCIGSRMIGNYVENNGISLEACTWYTCVGNVVINPVNVGINMQDCGEGGVVMGNTIKNVPSGAQGLAWSSPTIPIPVTTTIGPNTITLTGGVKYYIPISLPDAWSFIEPIYGAGLATLTLANGLNNNVAIAVNYRGISGERFAEIVGPTAAFIISGFTGGMNGAKLWISNMTAQTMTLDHQDSNSAAGNKIFIPGGASSITAKSATLIYDGGNWVVVGYF